MLVGVTKTGYKTLVLLLSFLMAAVGVFASGPTKNKIYEISADFSKVSYDGNASDIYNKLKKEGWELQCDAYTKTVSEIKEETAKMVSNKNAEILKNAKITSKDVENAVVEFNESKNIQKSGLKAEKSTFDEDKIYTESINEKLNDRFTAEDLMIPQHFGYAVGENIINDRKVYVIAFRGTADNYSWIFTDFIAFPTKFLDTETEVHVGFEWNRQTCMKRDILKNFIGNKVLKDTSNPLLIITGHSMGAALAVLETAYFIEKTSFSSKNIQLITLAEPCPGRENFVKRYKPQIKNYKWFTNLFDPVPILPMIVKYKHFDYLFGLKMFSLGPNVPPVKNSFSRHDLKYYREYIYSLDDNNEI